MAAVLKCTKVQLLGDNPLDSGSYIFKVDYTDPTTSPPTPGSVTFPIDILDAVEPTTFQTECNDRLAILGDNTINWAI